MVRILSAALVVVALAGCGGGDDDDLASRHGLQIKVAAWVDFMPTIGSPITCNPYRAVLTVDAANVDVPAGFKATSVRLENAQTTVPLSVGDSGLASGATKTTYSAKAAGGCYSSLMETGQTVDAILEFTIGDERGQLRAKAQIERTE